MYKDGGVIVYAESQNVRVPEMLYPLFRKSERCAFDSPGCSPRYVHDEKKNPRRFAPGVLRTDVDSAGHSHQASTFGGVPTVKMLVACWTAFREKRMLAEPFPSTFPLGAVVRSTIPPISVQ